MELKANTPTAEPDRHLVVFAPGDTEDPKNWPSARKWAVTNVLSITGFNRILVSTIMAPALSRIEVDLNMTSTESAMALSIYLLATAFGPLIIGPFSEVYGRQTILHASSFWFLIWNLACGFATSKELLIASRFLAGFGASAIYALAGGVLGDVWSREQRGKSLGVYLLIPLLGAAVGPILGGFMTGRATWRWMFWSTSAFQALMILFTATTFRETFAPVILRRRAKRLRRATGENYQTPEERFQQDMSIFSIIVRTFTRPLRLLLTHPIIQATAIISGFEYGLLYIVLSSFADLWIKGYGQPLELSGLHYLAVALGEMIASQLGGPMMDRSYKRMQQKADGEHSPEYRIPLIIPGAVLAPLGFILYGWTAQYRIHWLVVDIGALITCFGMQLSTMPLTAYVIDAYPDHTSSAVAAQQFLRALAAFLFPLFTPTMYRVLGYGWANTTVAFIGLIFGVPAPLLLWRYGARLRARAQSSF